MRGLTKATTWKVNRHYTQTICRVCNGVVNRRGNKFEHAFDGNRSHTVQPAIQETLEKVRLKPAVVPPLCPKCHHDYGSHLHLFHGAGKIGPDGLGCNTTVGDRLDRYCKCDYVPPKGFKLPEPEWD